MPANILINQPNNFQLLLFVLYAHSFSSLFPLFSPFSLFFLSRSLDLSVCLHIYSVSFPFIAYSVLCSYLSVGPSLCACDRCLLRSSFSIHFSICPCLFLSFFRAPFFCVYIGWQIGRTKEYEWVWWWVWRGLWVWWEWRWGLLCGRRIFSGRRCSRRK